MKRAYVSLLSGGDDYAPGVEALGLSLRAAGASAPMVLLATPDVSDAALNTAAAAGWAPRRVAPIENPSPDAARIFARFGRTCTKLRAFGLDDVETAVFLDADTLVLRNIDELFERPDFSAAPDFFVPDRFNSGVMVFSPSPARLDAMLEALPRCANYDGGDQGFLNEHIAGWWSMDAAHRLPARFNLHHFVFQFMAAHPSLRRQFLADVRVVHYTLQKPWLQPTVTGGSALWWERYLSAHRERDGLWRRELHAFEDWAFERLVATLGGA